MFRFFSSFSTSKYKKTKKGEKSFTLSSSLPLSSPSPPPTTTPNTTSRRTLRRRRHLRPGSGRRRPPRLHWLGLLLAAQPFWIRPKARRHARGRAGRQAVPHQPLRSLDPGGPLPHEQGVQPAEHAVERGADLRGGDARGGGVLWRGRGRRKRRRRKRRRLPFPFVLELLLPV